MNFLTMLLFLLLGCIILGVIRKLRGGTFLPPPAPEEEYVVYDRTGRPWRFDPKSGAWEELFKWRISRTRKPHRDADDLPRLSS